MLGEDFSQYGVLAAPGYAGGSMAYAPPLDTFGGSTAGLGSVNVPGISMPTGGAAPTGFAPSLGGPLGVAGLGLSALGSLGQLWMGMKAMKLAKQQFKFQKNITNTNLANQIQSYNTALADRARSRGVMEGQTADQVQGYINANSLSRDSGKKGPTSIGTISGAAMSNYSQYVRPSGSGGTARTDPDDGE